MRKSPAQTPAAVDRTPKSKTKIADRLTFAVDKATPRSPKDKDPKTSNAVHFRSTHLVPLTKEYHEMRSRLRNLIAAAKKYGEAQLSLDKARMGFAEKLAVLSKEPELSPLYDRVGNEKEPTSLLSVYGQDSKLATSQEGKFQSSIVDYAVEWESVITSRIDAELKENKKLQDSYTHYQTKVEGLRKKVSDLEQKGKETPDATKEKLQRNEGKLNEAWKEHEESTRCVCLLLEQATHYGWKDLFPLVKAVMKWEADRTAKEDAIFSAFTTDMTQMELDFKESCKTWKSKNAKKTSAD